MAQPDQDAVVVPRKCGNRTCVHPLQGPVGSRPVHRPHRDAVVAQDLAFASNAHVGARLHNGDRNFVLLSTFREEEDGLARSS